jgi:hypothetical protein
MHSNASQMFPNANNNPLFHLGVNQFVNQEDNFKNLFSV